MSTESQNKNASEGVAAQTPIPEKPCHCHYKASHWGWRVFEIAAVVAGVAYAIITFFMWRESHNNFVLEERAWLDVSKAEITDSGKDFHAGSPITAKVTLVNTGKTPAREVQAEYRIVLLRNTEEVPLSYDASVRNTDFIGLMPPNGSTEIAVQNYINRFEVEKFTEDEMKDIASGRAYLAVYGRIRYTDIFGEKHWFKNCVYQGWHSGSFQSGSCVAYNNTGDGDLPD